jgi:hypothetical protein
MSKWGHHSTPPYVPFPSFIWFFDRPGYPSRVFVNQGHRSRISKQSLTLPFRSPRSIVLFFWFLCLDSSVLILFFSVSPIPRFTFSRGRWSAVCGHFLQPCSHTFFLWSFAPDIPCDFKPFFYIIEDFGRQRGENEPCSDYRKQRLYRQSSG